MKRYSKYTGDLKLLLEKELSASYETFSIDIFIDSVLKINKHTILVSDNFILKDNWTSNYI